MRRLRPATRLPTLAAALAMTACSPDPEPRMNPTTTVTAFFQRLSDHDLEGVLVLLHDDFVLRNAEGAVMASREDMRSMLAWDIEARSRIEILSLHAEGDTVRVQLKERNRFTELLELGPWEVEASLRVREGRIYEEVAEEVAAEGPSLTERFQRALQPVVAWAEDVHPEEADAIFEEGRVARYDGPTARRLLRLVEAYRDPGRSSESEAKR